MKYKGIPAMVISGLIVAYITYNVIEKHGSNIAPVEVTINNNVNATEQKSSDKPANSSPKSSYEADNPIFIEKPSSKLESQDKSTFKPAEIVKSRPSINLNSAFLNTEGSNEMAVLILSNNSQPDNNVSKLIADKYTRTYRTTNALFPQSTINTPVVKQLFFGDSESMKALELKNHTDFICVGNISYNTRQNQIQKEMTTVEVSLDYTIYEVPSGTLVESFAKPAVGTGWSEVQARTNAISKLMSLISK